MALTSGSEQVSQCGWIRHGKLAGEVLTDKCRRATVDRGSIEQKLDLRIGRVQTRCDDRSRSILLKYDCPQRGSRIVGADQRDLAHRSNVKVDRLQRVTESNRESGGDSLHGLEAARCRV